MQQHLCLGAHTCPIYSILIRTSKMNDSISRMLNERRQTSKSPTAYNKVQPQRIEGRFLKGPIALSWLLPAIRLPGKAANLALAIRYASGLHKKDTVHLSPSMLREFGISRFSAYRALNQMISAGLVVATRRRGRAAEVTICPTKEGN